MTYHEINDYLILIKDELLEICAYTTESECPLWVYRNLDNAISKLIILQKQLKEMDENVN